MNETKYTLKEIKLQNGIVDRIKLDVKDAKEVYFRGINGIDLDDQLLIITSVKKIFNYDSFDIFLAKNPEVILLDGSNASNYDIFYWSVQVFFKYMIEIITKSAMKRLLCLCVEVMYFYCAFMRIFKYKFLKLPLFLYHKEYIHLKQVIDFVYAWKELRDQDYVFKFKIDT